jgi:hypothetical protein
MIVSHLGHRFFLITSALDAGFGVFFADPHWRLRASEIVSNAEAFVEKVAVTFCPPAAFNQRERWYAI